ncbi:MAG: InlB B-repeat-containing protein, partial [Clostridia bacterium]|nr:InlB B-repeat-containing protein [Clostridia bacterium]
ATQIAPITQNYGTAVTAPAAPTKTGYTFTGWDVEFPATMPAGDITLMAKWTVNQYTITFVDTGDNSIPPIVQDYGSAITAPADPTKQLYKFLGWDKEIPATMPAENITVTATWEQVIFTVSFYDGERLIDTLYAEKGHPVGGVPAVTRSSKENATLAGYFTDAEFTTRFYADTPVNDNISVYAKYEQMPDIETVTLTSFAQIDVAPDISFDILGSGNPVNGVTLEVMDGSSPVELAFTRIEGGYNVKAKKGFNPGASYQLHLADGWTFRDKAESVRTASFSIFMEEVENLRMNDDIVYIKDTDSISYNIGGGTYDVLTTSLITSDIGSFGYNGADMPEAGDIICIYVGTHPAEREGNADTLDPAVYVKTVGVHGGTITFTQLSAEDQLDLYEIPDNFPIIVAALPTADVGTANINALDAEMYATMMGEGYDLASAKLAIEVGDFVTLYVSQEGINSESDLYYGEITAYNSVTGEITFKRTTRQAILDSMDLYSKIDVEGSD